MSAGSFLWRGRAVPFAPGETIAAALAHAGVLDMGRDQAGNAVRYFCGIGACQGCLVRCEGRIVEACLTPAMDGAVVAAVDA
jgi:aerobic-type carbon monoxide dehydrogenase small subunit (CoxS/CutS family)